MIPGTLPPPDETAPDHLQTAQVVSSSEVDAAGSGSSGVPRFREPLALFLLLLACLSWVSLFKPDFDTDIWARMAVGKLVMESGGVTVVDPFSYTGKRAQWIDHEWGAGVAFYLLASLGGEQALLIFKALMMFGTLGFMYLRTRRFTGKPPSLTFHLLLLGALHLGFLASVRSQVFTYFFFSAWLYLLERASDGDWRYLWLIPLSSIFWANVHGGFLAGIGLIVLFAIGAFIQRGPFLRFGLLAGAAGLASLVNPYGLKYWGYLLDATSMDRSSITEWGPLELLGTQPIYLGFKILLVLVLVSVIGKALRREVPDISSIAVLAVTAALGLRVSRHTTFFVIASAPLAWSWMAGLVSQSRAGNSLSVHLTPTVRATYYRLSRAALLVGTLFTLTTTPLKVVFPRWVPVRAVDFIAQNNLCRNLLVHFNAGSYAIWRLYPQCRVSMDGRYETVYTEEAYVEVSNFFQGQPGWSDFLDKYPHDTILESPRRPAVEANLGTRPDWQIVYEDEKSRIYVRGREVRSFPPLAPPSQGDPLATSGRPRYVP